MLFCFVFFFLLIRPPPRSTRPHTLFPYTTLFRSIDRQASSEPGLPVADQAYTFPGWAKTDELTGQEFRHGRRIVQFREVHFIGTDTRLLEGDRKSTRLNSSH